MSDQVNVDNTILVVGAGGFIGGHLVKRLLGDKRNVIGVDIKPLSEWQQLHEGATNVQADFSDSNRIYAACPTSVSEVYNLAALAGGVGYLSSHQADCMLSVLINTHLLSFFRTRPLKNYFFASSGCVYNTDKQKIDAKPLKEVEDVYPALPDGGYGWEKLFSERLCEQAHRDYGIPTTIARFINVYGTHEEWDGEKTKGIAALCRKVIEAKHSGSNAIKIWGDGTQVRAWLYVDDCVDGILQLYKHSVRVPVNLGPPDIITISEIVSVLEEIAGVKLKREYQLDKPSGVNIRISDNTLIKKLLGWEPSIGIKDGLTRMYNWMEIEYRKKYL